MTEKPVELSITVKVYGEVIQYTRKIAIEALEIGISQVMQEIGNKALVAGLVGLDQELRQRVPSGWRNIGTEEHSIMSSMGWIRYQRRIYKDEKGRRRAAWMSSQEWNDTGGKVSECKRWEPIWPVKGPTGDQQAKWSWLMKKEVSHSSIQRMVGQVGNRIADGEDASVGCF